MYRPMDLLNDQSLIAEKRLMNRIDKEAIEQHQRAENRYRLTAFRERRDAFKDDFNLLNIPFLIAEV